MAMEYRLRMIWAVLEGLCKYCKADVAQLVEQLIRNQ
jgi:hypothetical protein